MSGYLAYLSPGEVRSPILSPLRLTLSAYNIAVHSYTNNIGIYHADTWVKYDMKILTLNLINDDGIHAKLFLQNVMDWTVGDVGSVVIRYRGVSRYNRLIAMGLAGVGYPITPTCLTRYGFGLRKVTVCYADLKGSNDFMRK